jgi:hypothetical protein
MNVNTEAIWAHRATRCTHGCRTKNRCPICLLYVKAKNRWFWKHVSGQTRFGFDYSDVPYEQLLIAIEEDNVIRRRRDARREARARINADVN